MTFQPLTSIATMRFSFEFIRDSRSGQLVFKKSSVSPPEGQPYLSGELPTPAALKHLLWALAHFKYRNVRDFDRTVSPWKELYNAIRRLTTRPRDWVIESFGSINNLVCIFDWDGPQLKIRDESLGKTEVGFLLTGSDRRELGFDEIEGWYRQNDPRGKIPASRFDPSSIEPNPVLRKRFADEADEKLELRAVVAEPFVFVIGKVIWYAQLERLLTQTREELLGRRNGFLPAIRWEIQRRFPNTVDEFADMLPPLDDSIKNCRELAGYSIILGETLADALGALQTLRTCLVKHRTRLEALSAETSLERILNTVKHAADAALDEIIRQAEKSSRAGITDILRHTKQEIESGLRSMLTSRNDYQEAERALSKKLESGATRIVETIRTDGHNAMHNILSDFRQKATSEIQRIQDEKTPKLPDDQEELIRLSTKAIDACDVVFRNLSAKARDCQRKLIEYLRKTIGSVT